MKSHGTVWVLNGDPEWRLDLRQGPTSTVGTPEDIPPIAKLNRLELRGKAIFNRKAVPLLAGVASSSMMDGAPALAQTSRQTGDVALRAQGLIEAKVEA